MVIGGWYTCPDCHRRLIKIGSKSTIYLVPVYCRVCKAQRFPAIWNGREIGSGKPFPPLAGKIS